jgi:hypothetical protein
MLFPFFTKQKPRTIVFTISKQKDTDPEQVEFYRECSIYLTLKSTNNWNEVWSYTIVTDYGDGTEIGKGNGLASKAIAMQCAKSWIDDVLGDRKSCWNESVVRDDWLSLKLENRQGFQNRHKRN